MITGFIAGFITGFIFSMPPLGPTYFAIIEKGLKKQPKNAVAIGVGAGFMDMIYILIAYGGVSLLISILPEAAHDFFYSNEDTLKMVLAFAGCIVVIFYGIKIMKTKSNNNSEDEKEPDINFSNKYVKLENAFKKTEVGFDKLFHTKVHDENHSEIFKNFLVGIVMCLSSITLPASWFATVGYLKSYGIIDTSILTGLFLAIGVLIGTSVWFYLMTKFIIRNSEKLKPAFLNKLNLFTGIFLIILGSVFIIKIYTVYF